MSKEPSEAAKAAEKFKEIIWRLEKIRECMRAPRRGTPGAQGGKRGDRGRRNGTA